MAYLNYMDDIQEGGKDPIFEIWIDLDPTLMLGNICITYKMTMRWHSSCANLNILRVGKPMGYILITKTSCSPPLVLIAFPLPILLKALFTTNHDAAHSWLYFSIIGASSYRLPFTTSHMRGIHEPSK